MVVKPKHQHVKYEEERKQKNLTESSVVLTNLRDGCATGAAGGLLAMGVDRASVAEVACVPVGRRHCCGRVASWGDGFSSWTR